MGTLEDKLKPSEFVAKLIVDAFENIDASRMDILKKYLSMTKDKDRQLYDIYMPYVYAWHTMVRKMRKLGYNVPYRSIPKR